MRCAAVVGPGWVVYFHQGYRLRIGLVSPSLQPERSLRWLRPTRLVGVAWPRWDLLAAVMEPEPPMGELTDDADSDSTDGS